jgi:ferredoxin
MTTTDPRLGEDAQVTRMVIDRGRCQGHGRCYTLAERVFDCDEEGFPLLRVPDGVVPAELRSDATSAVQACPEQALSLVSAPAGAGAGGDS